MPWKEVSLISQRLEFVMLATDENAYIGKHPEFGWLAFGGNVKVRGDLVRVQTRDSFRMRSYVAPFGLWLTLDAGTFESMK